MSDLFEILNDLNIKFELVNHQAVFTCEEAESVKKLIDGQGCKNLFLKSAKKEYFLCILPDNKKADLKITAKSNGFSRFSFANEEELYNILKLKKGSVTPFGIINNSEHNVKILIDKELKGKKLLFHPNINTSTISIDFDDFIKFIEFEKNEYIFI